MKPYYLLFCFLLVSCVSIPKSHFSIKFIVDKNYDEAMIYNIFKSDDPAGLLSRSQSMGINYSLAKKIRESGKYSDIKIDLDKLVNDKYSEIGNQLSESALTYSSSWEQITDDFSFIVKDITGCDWFYSNYICVVSAFHPGVSNWYGNKIIRKYGENPIKQRRITAHEIVLSHIFRVCRVYYSQSEINDASLWEIAEITAVLILDDNRLLKYWDDYVPPKNYFSKSNYPQLANLEDKLRVAYRDRNDFKEYLKNAVQIVGGIE
jgi:hypothetical protein